MAKKEYLNDDQNYYPYQEDLVFNDLTKFLQRNAKLIIKFALSGLGLSIILFFIYPRTWKGEFQIVINQKNDLFKGQSFSTDTNKEELVNLFSQGNNGNNLKTQIGILKSPSILFDIYEFVKNEKNSHNKNSKNFSFKDWEKNFKFANEKGTSILDISYTDKRKDIILPVLIKVSNSYQEYSLKERKRSLELISKYLKEQLNIFEQKTFKSIREAQQFAINQNLTILDKTELDKEIPNALNIEKIRLEAGSKIKQSNFILEQIKLIGDNPEMLIYVARSIEGLDKDLEDLDQLQNEISFKNKIYTNNEYNFKLLKSKRDNLIEILRSKAISIQNAEILVAEALLKSSERPKGVIIKYKQLLSKAANDKLTFSELNKQFRFLNLEMAKINDPWELITSPTLDQQVFSPKKKRFLFLGLFLGTFTGIVFSAFKEKKDVLLNSEN